MQTFKKGEFISWTGVENGEQFTHVGQVIKHANGVIAFIDSTGGEMHIPETDGEIKITKKPRNWEANMPTKRERKAKPTSIKKPVEKKKPVQRSKSGETKLDAVIKLLRDNPPANRKDAIQKIVDAGITTPAGASTYYSNAKKHL